MQTTDRRLSRRSMLLAGAALPIPVFLQERPALLDDTDLLARLELVQDLLAAWERVRDVAHAAYEASREQGRREGLYPFTGPDEEKRRARQDELDELHGYDAAYDVWNAAAKVAKEAVAAVFAMPANTLPGVLGKLRLVSRAYLDGYEGDADMVCWQDDEAPWIDLVLADLERLAGSAST